MSEMNPATFSTPAPSAPSSRQVLRVEDLVVHFPVLSGLLKRKIAAVHAVDGVSFTVDRGETLGIVGESGCGKTTLGRSILGLAAPTSGRVAFPGFESTDDRFDKALRRAVQGVFQDPFASLDPRMTLHDIVAEPLRVHGLFRGKQAPAEMRQLFERVGLRWSYRDRYPSEFSGGQRQRIGIARALALKPKLLVLDEPVSALDVSIQAQILNLLADIQQATGVAYVFISHDLSVVRHIADRVAVMYMGKFVETGRADVVADQPAHPYTEALLSAVPSTHPDRASARERIVLTGDVPNPLRPPSGCRFRTRCWKAQSICAEQQPPLVPHDGSQPVACHFPQLYRATRGGYQAKQETSAPGSAPHADG
jgi:peptide/nickel transport system ATP-binding protein/oligopeptide transport system ATP-binding protein